MLNKRTFGDWLKVLVLLLDEAAVVALVFIILWALDIKIPLPVVIPVALALGALVFIIHKAVIPTFHKKRLTGSEGMVGLKGEVTQSLTPIGTVRVGSEYWKAKSVADNIAVGEEVEILGLEGLTLKVKRKSGS